MTRRKAIPAHVKVSVAIRQATNLSGLVPQSVQCPLCGFPLLHDQPRILEHTPARAILIANGVENPDDPKYLSWVHAACAKTKTNGNGATCADGDIHKIAKAKRLARAQEVHRAVLAGTHKREPSRIKSRGFDKTRTRKFNGEVTKRESI